MSTRKRDYAAEYRRRLARAREFGYSKSVARGHPRKGEVPLRQLNRVEDRLRKARDTTYKPQAQFVQDSILLGQGTTSAFQALNATDSTTMEEFLALANSLGLSERQAYKVLGGS